MKLTLLWPSVCTATNMAATTRRMIKTKRLETKRTDFPYPLLCTALITTKLLFAIYNTLSSQPLTLARGDGKVAAISLSQGGLKIPSW